MQPFETLLQSVRKIATSSGGKLGYQKNLFAGMGIAGEPATDALFAAAPAVELRCVPVIYPPIKSLIMPEWPKGLRGMGSLGMVIWAETWWGCQKEEPPTVAPKPMAAAFLKNWRRLGFPLLSSWDDMIHTSLLGLSGRVQPATGTEIENRLELVSTPDLVLGGL